MRSHALHCVISAGFVATAFSWLMAMEAKADITVTPETGDVIQTVRLGDGGKDVRRLQEALKTNKFNVKTNGAFDSHTRAAVEAYQIKNNLKVDGIAGPETLKSLGLRE